ncbi:secreted RxLR effector protein 161-like [Capsicum annuum]|uniref:secreted RxLR effector protein 161-like n=1 Tax=Capsicum annuum TaxID=4072 RepID=UPI001FB13704|nr:secreted RxLR effector protein 161-like [Capsicum annuum]
MVVRSLDINKDSFRPHENDEELVGAEISYLSAIGALMYLDSNSRSDISFDVNLLARFSSSPIRRHWNDVGYLSDPHKDQSQTGYLFIRGGTVISWHSTKQIMVATSSNHAEIIAINEASQECVWLRSITQYVQETCGLPLKMNIPTILYEDSVACIDQLRGGYIKGDRTKYKDR